MENVMIVPLGGDVSPLYVGLRSFNTSKIVLVSPTGKLDEAEKLKEDLEKFKIPIEIKKIQQPILEDMFRIVGEISKKEKGQNIIINVSTGDQMSSCAALSAAFVNGLKAFGMMGDEPMLFPVLKFNYYHILTERKMRILKILAAQTEPISLEQLSKKAKLSPPLLSYHINGNQESTGLKELGLIEVEQGKGKNKTSLSPLGKMLVKGYVDQPD